MPPPARPARSSRTTARATARPSPTSRTSRSSDPDPDENAGDTTPMALNRIWVYAEAADGKVAPITLEMLSKARELGGTVEAVYGDGDGDTIAETLGAHGATRVYATGDLQGSTPGVPVAAARPKLTEGGEAPDLLLFGPTYGARDVAARLSVALDKPVITNNTDIAVDGDDVVATEPVFGGTKLVRTKFTAGGPHIALIRPKSFAAEESGGGPAEIVTIEVPDYGTAKVKNRHVEETTGPKLDEAAVVVSGGRGLGAAEKYQIIED